MAQKTFLGDVFAIQIKLISFDLSERFAKHRSALWLATRDRDASIVEASTCCLLTHLAVDSDWSALNVIEGSSNHLPN